jgi:predicted RNA binding protein YcfA (HicA-like mRNA interferase family)
MKLPRGVSAERLVRPPEHVEYAVIRQRESHARLRHQGPPPHTVTVPMHNPLKTGTLHGILTEVAHVGSIPVESLSELL